MPEITNMPAPETKQEIPVIPPEGDLPVPPHVDTPEDEMPFVLDAEAEAAIDATLARIETRIVEHVMTVQKTVRMPHVLAVLAEIEMRTDRILASIFGAK